MIKEHRTSPPKVTGTGSISPLASFKHNPKIQDTWDGKEPFFIPKDYLWIRGLDEESRNKRKEPNMKLTSENLLELATLAEKTAMQAGEFIAENSKGDVVVQSKNGGDTLASCVVTKIDIRSQEIILDALGPTLARFDLGLLSEESPDDSSRFEKNYFWAIDPLDGTLPFTEGRHGYAVSIALVSCAGVPVVGVVYDPVRSKCYKAVSGQGVWVDGTRFAPVTSSKSSKLTLIFDRSFLNHERYPEMQEKLQSFAREHYSAEVEVIAFGGAVMNALWVLERSPACYFKFPKKSDGGGSIWDYSATACIFVEAGGFASDIYGNPLDLNRADSTFLNHRGVVFASDKRLSEFIKELTF